MDLKKRSTTLLTGASIVAIALVIFFIRWSNTKASSGDHQSDAHSYREPDLRVAIIPAPDNTYGYEILMNGRILIHQPHIPAIPGNEGFKKKEDAQTVAEFLIHKLRQNIFPPSVSVEELDSLGVL